MSRLQVGGLALVIDAQNRDNVGKIVRLIEYYGCYAWLDDGWFVEISDGKNIFDEFRKDGVLSAKNLMPLGDDYTQELLKKESVSELEEGV